MLCENVRQHPEFFAAIPTLFWTLALFKFRTGGNTSLGDLSIEIDGIVARSREELSDRVEQLYQDQYGRLYRYLLHTGSSPTDADEFIQEVFLRLFQTLRDGNRIEKPVSWLFGALHHIGIDEIRRSSRHVEFDALHAVVQDSHVCDTQNPEAELLERERTARLEKAMRQLTERQYRYLLLRIEGLKLREIAEVFGVTVQSVAESCTRAIDHLGRLMHD